MLAIIPHLEYEVSMLRGALVEYHARDWHGIRGSLDRADPERIARTSFFEVLLLHARVLNEFLSGTDDDKRDDDLWAGDYFNTGDWNPVCQPLNWVGSVAAGLTVAETINKQLAHLSTTRIQQWRFHLERVEREVVAGMREFANDTKNLNYSNMERLRELLADWPPPLPPRPDDMKWTYRVEWSADDDMYVGLCDERPELLWLDPNPSTAMAGIQKRVEEWIYTLPPGALTPGEESSSQDEDGSEL